MESRPRKLIFFGALYFLQGAAFAYAVNFQKPYLAAAGISTANIGLFTSILLLPFILKIGLGWLSDHRPIGKWGGRKPYMLMGLVIFAGGYGTLASLDPSQSFLIFAVVTWLASLGLALFDTCADAWAIDIAKDDEMSSIQAAMVSGRSLGLIAMSLGFGFLAKDFGVNSIFMALAVLATGVWFLVLAISPPKAIVVAEIPRRPKIWPPAWAWVAFAIYGVSYSMASFGSDGLMTLYMAKAQSAGSLEIGFFGFARGIGAILGALTFAFITRWFPLRKVLIGNLLGLGLASLLAPHIEPFWLRASTWGLFWGLQETAYVTLAMIYSRGPWAATLFAVWMIFSNVGTALGEAVAGAMVGEVGFAGVFGGLGVLAWVTMALTPWLKAGEGNRQPN
ncbi:MAG: MFS transporter [Bdellovibrionales bacterium]